MKRKDCTVGEYLLTRLKQIGVDHLFGVPGDFVLAFFNQVLQSDIPTGTTAPHVGQRRDCARASAPFFFRGAEGRSWNRASASAAPPPLAAAGLEGAASLIIASSNVSRWSPAATGITGSSMLLCSLLASSIVDLPLVPGADAGGCSRALSG